MPTERKIVSIFFVDLVGSTAFAESADPEDVQEVLQAYHELVRDELERYGGSVQKFVGDAVMAVFGAPVAHEDDPERAVRAALRVVDLVTEQGLSSRAAVHTGEAVVTVGARPERGEAMVAGDVVNTAARLQSAAPADGVVVGEVTWRSTRTVVEYEQLPAVTVKGKASPVPLWRAVGARSRFGVEADPRTDVVHVGREDELDLLRRVYGRAVRDRSVQLVTVSGEPGIGKSRLVAEFGAWVDTLPELVSWRQGRCLPYGQGLTFWALGEVVKAHIGLLDDDPPGKARLRLAEAVADAAVPAEDQAWMVERLAPLVGLKEQVETAGQEENFAAWRGFLEAIAAGDPFVLVVEDLHWADEPLLQFLEHLLGWGSDVPLLVLATARPELFDRQPGWGSAGRSATRIALSPLSQTGSARLIADLAGAELPPAVADLVVDRCGGNPLYAAEFIRMLAERDLLRPDADLSGLPLPDSVQAVIAARLDGLGADRKALLADAAVVGRTFWAASLTAVGDRQPAAVAAALRELVATQLIRPVRSTSLRGQQEYAFWHALVRDVAYAQLPRSQRSQRHVAAAQWLTATVGERVGDVAGLLVNHYQQAHRLAAAAGQPTTTIEPALAEALLLAARHAPDITTVGHHLREALTRLPADSPTRLAATIDLADVLRLAAQEPEAIHLLEQAIDDAKRHGDRRAEGRALARFSAAIEDRDADRSGRAITAAVAVLEPLGDSPELAEALYGQAVEEYRRTGLIPAPVFSRVIQLAEKWSLAHLRVMALAVRGQGRLDEGNDSGLADIEEAMQAGMAVLQPSPQIASAVSMVYNNYGTSLWWWVGPSAAVAMLKAGQEWSSRRGLTYWANWMQVSELPILWDLGQWSVIPTDISASAGEHEDFSEFSETRALAARRLLHTGELEAAWQMAQGALEAARRGLQTDDLVNVLVTAMLVANAQNAPVARILCGELDRMDRSGSIHRGRDLCLSDVVRQLLQDDEFALARRWLDVPHHGEKRIQLMVQTGRAALAEAEGHHDEAAQGYEQAIADWRTYGSVPEQFEALIGAARSKLNLGHQTAGETHLQAARNIAARLASVPYLARCDQLARSHQLGATD